jgi:hypothetical protein
MTNLRQQLVLSAAVPVVLLLPVTRAQRGADAASAISPIVAESVITCLTGDSLLDTPIMRELLGILWGHSNADDRPAQRRERGAILFEAGGVLFYRADLDNPADTPCRSAVIVPLGPTPVAAVFTHPFRPGDLLPANCSYGRPESRRYTVDRYGGPSEEDIVALLDWGIPGYIIDGENVYAIPVGTTTETARLIVKRYPRTDKASACNVITAATQQP